MTKLVIGCQPLRNVRSGILTTVVEIDDILVNLLEKIFRTVGPIHELAPVTGGYIILITVKERSVVVQQADGLEEVNIDLFEVVNKNNSEETDVRHVREGKEDEGSVGYVIERVNGHAVDNDGKLPFQISWVSFEGITWELVNHFLYSKIFFYWRQKKINLSEDIHLARDG